MRLEKTKVRVTHRGRVLFSGSETAFRIWCAGHWLPPTAEVEVVGGPLGPSGRGCGRELQGGYQVAMGDGSNTLPKQPHGCHSARVGWPM